LKSPLLDYEHALAALDRDLEYVNFDQYRLAVERYRRPAQTPQRLAIELLDPRRAALVVLAEEIGSLRERWAARSNSSVRRTPACRRPSR